MKEDNYKKETPKNSTPDQKTKQAQRAERRIAAVLVFCICIVGFWEVMAHRSDRPFAAFELSAEDLSSFEPMSTKWFVEMLPVSPDPVEPNILMCLLRPQLRQNGSEGAVQPMLLRLVHGFNLVDCMLEKGHEVELLASTRTEQTFEQGITLPESLVVSGRKVQIWRVTSPTGDRSLWVSTMLRAGDFMQTDVDTRAMPFPRVPYPERAAWTPRGLTVEGMKHPIEGMKKFLQYKWNSSRGDLLTFIDLKQEEWASEDELTLVTLTKGKSLTEASEHQVLKDIFSAHFEMHDLLKKWRHQNQSVEDGA